MVTADPYIFRTVQERVLPARRSAGRGRPWGWRRLLARACGSNMATAGPYIFRTVQEWVLPARSGAGRG
jgi:hypothetical protein